MRENSTSQLDPNLEWSDEFIQQASTQFEDAMRHFLSEDQSLSEEFRKMAEATGKASKCSYRFALSSRSFLKVLTTIIDF